jgi:TonB family protein
LAARIVVSPEGTKPGAGAPQGGSNGESAGAAGGAPGGNAAAGRAGSLPASIYVGPGKQPAKESGGIGAKPLDLSIRASNAASAAASAPHADVPRPRVVQPGEPPEKILSGKEVYTLHLNLPNLTSSRGSWVLSFAQLDEGEGLPPSARLGDLSGPTPLETVDPKYPQIMIDQHVHGQVVLYAIIRKDGSVDSIQLVESLDPVLDKNAIRALGLWKFQPGKRRGVPVDLEAVVYIPFEYRSLLQ